MRVLITNSRLADRTGSETYVFDLALELTRRGHEAALFVLRDGPYADELRLRGVRVVTDPGQLSFTPDIIHGNSHRATLAALRRFTNTPAIFVCHNHNQWADAAPLHPRILRYFGVSLLCADRIGREGVSRSDVSLSLNWVDTTRFARRGALPESPRRALMFSNYANESSYLPVIREACQKAGLLLDAVGIGSGNPVAHPEHMLPRYDIVFAKAKAAMEAMSVGNAVVLCDYGGVGPLVSPGNFARLMPMNFGFQALVQPITVDALMTQITAYSPRNSAQVCELIRGAASIQARVAGIEAEYREVITDFESGGVSRYKPGLSYHARNLGNAGVGAAIQVWLKLPAAFRKQLKSNDHLNLLLQKTRCLFVR